MNEVTDLAHLPCGQESGHWLLWDDTGRVGAPGVLGENMHPQSAWEAIVQLVYPAAQECHYSVGIIKEMLVFTFTWVYIAPFLVSTVLEDTKGPIIQNLLVVFCGNSW